jgi:uncharacterized metal-binding protein YceD (DUF177 family)
MKVPIASIQNKIIEIHEKMLDINLGSNITIVSPIVLTGEMVDDAATDKVHFKGRITAKLSLICVQCLEKFEEALDIGFEETYLPKSENKSDISEKELVEDLDMFIYHGDYIDTAEIVRGILLETIPPYPLCHKCRALDNS